MEASQRAAMGNQAIRPESLQDVPKPSIDYTRDSVDGPPVTPEGRIQLYSSDQWEEFIREYVLGLERDYFQVKRFGGAGDKGADIAALRTKNGLDGAWDCYQGKHYSKSLSYSNAAPEVLKVFTSVLQKAYAMPDSYNFLAPRGASTQLNQLLSSPVKLKEKFLADLDKGESWARIDSSLAAKVRHLAAATDFSMFRSVELADALVVHHRTPYYAYRFATALKSRPVSSSPPQQVMEHESQYVAKLVNVYCERWPSEVIDATSASTHARTSVHFRRQRVTFFKAEALRLYARDAVPPGTFEKLTDDVFSGVVDVAESDHQDGFARLRMVLAQAGTLDLSAHRLITVAEIDDRKGICHHLANDGKLDWVTDDSAQ